MAQSARPQLVAPRAVQTLEAIRSIGGSFDPDVFHVMERRDDQLIADEILHGPGSSKFVYSFDIAGQREPVTGISVVGARHLAAHYKGLKHRLVAAMQKTGSLFTFTSYPAENLPMAVSCSVVPELADEDDFYAAICEVVDIKTGNAIQVERRELRYEERRGGGHFERPHYATIAQSKAYRNAVLALVPQDIVIRWKLEHAAAQKGRGHHRVGDRREARERSAVRREQGDRAGPPGDRLFDPRPDRGAWRRSARGTIAGLCRGGTGPRARDRARVHRGGENARAGSSGAR